MKKFFNKDNKFLVKYCDINNKIINLYIWMRHRLAQVFIQHMDIAKRAKY